MKVGITLQIEVEDVQKFLHHNDVFTGAIVGASNDKPEETAEKESAETSEEDTKPKTKKKSAKKKSAKKKVTKEDVRAAMQEVHKTHNLAAVIGVLGTFGVGKLDDVKPEDYESILATYKELKEGVNDEG